jgi:hypothetical protein
MFERIVSTYVYIPGTTAANHVFIQEFPYPSTLLAVKACASNDSDAKLGVGGGATVTSAVIGDSADPATLTPTSIAQAAADTAYTFTLDYDGAGGTAAQNVSIQAFYLVDEG